MEYTLKIHLLHTSAISFPCRQHEPDSTLARLTNVSQIHKNTNLRIQDQNSSKKAPNPAKAPPCSMQNKRFSFYATSPRMMSYSGHSVKVWGFEK
jgi:hypothetical protein